MLSALRPLAKCKSIVLLSQFLMLRSYNYYYLSVMGLSTHSSIKDKEARTTTTTDC